MESPPGVAAAGLTPIVLGSIQPGETTGQDTRRAAQDMAAQGVGLLLFAGGDGTARGLGTELDVGLDYTLRLEDWVQLDASVEAGRLFPGEAFTEVYYDVTAVVTALVVLFVLYLSTTVVPAGRMRWPILPTML